MLRKNYPYLKDTDFLYLVDTQHLQNQYVKITLLDWNENPIKEIQGIATGGSVSINGSSSVRRTCSLSMSIVNNEDSAIDDAKSLISIGRKVYLEIGIENKTNKYQEEYPIIWFPQGFYVFTQCSLSTSLSQITILSAQLKDKMCLLNGECGGVITATTQFDKWDTIDNDGNWVTEKYTISQIIREAVNHLGGEQLGRILISDIDEKVKMVERWLGNNPVYLINQSGNYFLTTDKSSYTNAGIQEFNYGDDIGFIYTSFVYPNELIANPGDNICTAVLDKIKNFLGNYEYYYDINGNFVFQEIKNYLNTTQATVELDKMTKEDYKVDISKGKSVYDFTDNKLAISFSNTPQYTRIKNDFVIWGTRKGSNDIHYPIRYHLAIDKKPETGKIYQVYFYTDPDDGLRKAKVPVTYNSKNNFPSIGAADIFYLDSSTNMVYKWDTVNLKYVSASGYEVKQYDNYEDFPELGEEGYIYLDASTQKTYQWLLDENSEHYAEIQAEINALTEQYEADVAALQALIDALQLSIDDVLSRINELKKDWEPYLEELYSFETDVANLQAIITNKNNQISEYQTTLGNLENQLIEYQNEYNSLMTLAIQAPDEETRQYYLNLAAKVQVLIDGVQESIINIQNSITNLQTEIVDTQNQITNFNSYIATVQEKLGPYYVALAELTNEYNAYMTVMNGYLEQMAALKEQYEVTFAALQRSQHEYIIVTFDVLTYVQATDWRSELYLQGASAEALGLYSNYYYAELYNEWPKLYNLTASSYIDDSGKTIYTGAFYDNVLEYPWDLDYWLDFIDTETEVGALSIDNIGRRSLSENKENYNCLFEPEIPDFILIESGQEDTQEKREECEARAQQYIQVEPNIFELLGAGGMKNSCFNRVKEALYDYTDYNNSITISCLPIYHLEPNTRITVVNKENNLFGDYLINSISSPLTINGNMTINAVKCNPKL